MVPGQYSFLIVSMIEECISFLCRKEDHTLQYVILSNEVGLTLFSQSFILDFCLFFEDQGSMHWDYSFDITDAVIF
jgi:hypothetical protein